MKHLGYISIGIGSVALFCGIVDRPAIAQIAADGTLSTTVTSQNNLNFTIDSGNRVGGNLFHSFNQFSVPTGGSVVFNNGADIQNIISRVTGGNLSTIDGLIKANSQANLFLINPSGIILGSNATLNIGGLFVGSTANTINFADGTQFSATKSPTAPLLTINVPIGWQSGSNFSRMVVQSQLPKDFFANVTPEFTDRGDISNNLIDTKNQIATTCARTQGNDFTVTGRGGLPEDATQFLRGQGVWRDLRLAEGVGEQGEKMRISQSPVPNPQTPIVEAQGWLVDGDGKVRLVVQGSQVTPQQSWHRAIACGDLRE